MGATTRHDTRARNTPNQQTNNRHCDDQNNNCGCNWDGGDCCGTEIYYSYEECDECACKMPDNCDVLCEHRAWAGDGYCDDENNGCGCDWDGGDCCDLEVLTTIAKN